VARIERHTGLVCASVGTWLSFAGLQSLGCGESRESFGDYVSQRVRVLDDLQTRLRLEDQQKVVKAQVRFGVRARLRQINCQNLRVSLWVQRTVIICHQIGAVVVLEDELVVLVKDLEIGQSHIDASAFRS